MCMWIEQSISFRLKSIAQTYGIELHTPYIPQ